MCTMCDNLVNDNKLVSMTKKSKIYTILLVITITEARREVYTENTKTSKRKRKDAPCGRWR